MHDLIPSIAAHIHQLSQAIGPRPSASPGGHRAAEYIAGQMRQFGLDVELQSFACPAWTCEAAEITLDGHPVEVLANAYSPACDLTAAVVPAATLAELDEKRAEIGGRIVLIYGDLTRTPIAPKSWFLKEERDERIIQLLEQEQPAAVLTVQAQPGSTNRLIEDWEFTLPSATLPSESALFVLNHLDRPAHLRLKTSQQPGTTANVVGRRLGQRPETVVLCAHYDTKIGTPGTCDNATGVAALLALAEYYAGSQPETGLEFVAFTNEEYLPIGDETYLACVGEDHLQQVVLAVNFDGLGHILDANSLAIFASSEEFQATVNGISCAFPALQWVEPWPESNHSTFAWRGVPSLAVSSRAATHYAHQREDTIRWVSPARVAEAVSFTTRIIDAVQAQPLAWLRPG